MAEAGYKQNRSTEGCSKLKRSVDMTSTGKNGLNIRTNASPKWEDQVSGGVSVLCWLAAPVAMFYGNLQNSVIRSNSTLCCFFLLVNMTASFPNKVFKCSPTASVNDFISFSSQLGFLLFFFSAILQTSSENYVAFDVIYA